MVFNSFVFIFAFFPLAGLVYSVLHRSGSRPWAQAWLIAVSWAFYAWGNPGNLPILLVSMAFNFAIGRRLGALRAGAAKGSDPGRGLLFAGIAANLLLLCGYKYTGFILENIGVLTGIPVQPLRIALPLGISFFTLQQVMYLVDCHEGLIAPNSFREHALFVSFFPSVSMGPITRAKEFLAQVRDISRKPLDPGILAPALALFSLGLVKKAILADSFSLVADSGFDSPVGLSMLEGWICSIAYCLQLYFDFSGYSDMAVAAALALGIRLPSNFNDPYRAVNIIDFWKRWHITLSSFITTYLYTPLVRSFRKLTFAKAMWATFLSMVIAGLWHGSSWNFIVFGSLHGAGLVVNQIAKKKKWRKLPRPFAWALTMAYVNFAFVFFRAADMAHAWGMLEAMAGAENAWGYGKLAAAIRGAEWMKIGPPALLGLIFLAARPVSADFADRFRPSAGTLAWATFAMALSLLYLNSNMGKGFVYFNF